MPLLCLSPVHSHIGDMRQVTLNDRYNLEQTRVFLTGAQAIIRLALMQHERDTRAGLNTAGYITGYRGSPIGTLDQQLAGAAAFLNPRSIVFQPGLNEDLAATALWGAQQAELRGDGKYDGVFGIWYGKGPGVDRSGDGVSTRQPCRDIPAWRRDRSDGRRSYV